jgi:ADP-ribosyl-[dinitrogen reductase] hydrolase
MAATPERAPVLDRAVGAVLGLAVGDALGTTLEFRARDSVPWHDEMLGGGVFGLAPGVSTDDTAMALALATSLVERGTLDASDVAARFLAWWRTGAYSPTGTCFDIGTTTADARRRFEATGDPFAGSVAPDTAGNGSLMRLAPAVLPHLHDADAAMAAAAAQSRITHAAPEAVDACRAFANLLVHAIRTGRADARWPAGLAAAVAALATLPAEKPREAIRSSGYVIHTVEAALWAVSTTDSFEAAVVRAVNLGEDADTVGAVTGQLAGAIHGASAIPDRWLARLAWRDRIEALALRLAAVPAATLSSDAARGLADVTIGSRNDGPAIREEQRCD